MVIPFFIRIFANESKIKIMFGTKRIKELDRKNEFLQAQLEKYVEILDKHKEVIQSQGRIIQSLIRQDDNLHQRILKLEERKDDKKPFI